jgi:chromate transporter
MAVAAACVVFALPPAVGQIGAIVLGAVFGLVVLGRQDSAMNAPRSHLPVASSPTVAIACFVVFLALLLFLSPIAAATGSHTLRLIAAFYRTGALVFGGGHVMLPLLQSSVVPPGWISNDAFLAGYGAAQAIPGPLSTFAAYLGVAMGPAPHGWLGSVIALLAIYAPSFLLLAAALPFWNALRHKPAMQAALRGINAAVVGVLLAALYTPVWTSAVHGAADFAVALAAFLLLSVWSVAPWLVVVLGAGASAALGWWGVGL